MAISIDPTLPVFPVYKAIAEVLIFVLRLSGRIR
jgi:hypothetical protein